MNSNNNGSGTLGEDNSSLSQDPAQTITITIMEPRSALGDTIGTTSVSASTLNRNFNSVVSSGSGADTLLVVPRRGTTEEEKGTSTFISEKPEHILQTSISKTQLEEEFPVISNISNPEEEEESLGQELPKENEIYDEEVDIAASSDPHCLVCNKELPQNTDDTPVAIFQVQTTATQRKMSVMLGVLVGQKITSRKSHSDLLCSRCFNLLDKVDSLEIELQDTKDDLINKYQSTYAIYGGRPPRKKAATAKRKEFVFPKIEPDEIEKEDSLELDSNFEPRAEDLLEEEADQQEDLVASGALDDEWEPEFKKPKLKRENTDADGGEAPKRRRGRPRKDITKAKECEDEIMPDAAACLNDAMPSISHNARLGAMKLEPCTYCGQEIPVVKLLSHLQGHEQRHHPCPFCKFTAPRLAMSHHLQQHHRESILSCEVCRLKFYDNIAFDQHKEGHVTGKHKCKLCGLNFSTANELINHKNVIHTLKTASKFTCSACQRDFSYWSSLVAHVVKNHRGQVDVEGLTWGPRGSLICSVCSQKFKKIAKFIAHERMHASEKLFCQHCKLNFPCESSLLNHLEIEKSLYQANFKCQVCQLNFNSSEELNIHNAIHPKVEDETAIKNYIYDCKTCGKEYRNKVQLVCHRRKEHPDSEEAISAKFSCSQCGMKFAGKGNLIKHIKMHQKLKLGNSRVCDICGKILSNKYTLATHMKTHSCNVSFKCTICDKNFFSKYTLIAHIRRIHDESDIGRDKVCNVCGRSFFTNSELKYHLKSHTGERPYHCQICGETYLSSSTLRYHIQKHSSVMFVCQNCNARFKNYVGWSAHMKRVHGIVSVKDYTKQHGILQAMTEKEPFVMVSRDIKNIKSEVKNITKESKDFSSTASRGDLCIGLNETVVDLPCDQEYENNVIHVVSYDDLTDPHLAVHTVEAGPLTPEARPLSPEAINESTTCEGGYKITNGPGQSSETSHVIIPEGWDVILPPGSEIIEGDNWDRTRIEGSSGAGDDAEMTLGDNWEN